MNGHSWFEVNVASVRRLTGARSSDEGKRISARRYTADSDERAVIGITGQPEPTGRLTSRERHAPPDRLDVGDRDTPGNRCEVGFFSIPAGNHSYVE
jgi:hypothetical protein